MAKAGTSGHKLKYTNQDRLNMEGWNSAGVALISNLNTEHKFYASNDFRQDINLVGKSTRRGAVTFMWPRLGKKDSEGIDQYC